MGGQTLATFLLLKRAQTKNNKILSYNASKNKNISIRLDFNNFVHTCLSLNHIFREIWTIGINTVNMGLHFVTY